MTLTMFGLVPKLKVAAFLTIINYMRTIRAQIIDIDFKLKKLESEKVKLLVEKDRLVKSLNIPVSESTLSPDQKVSLFASLFKGRQEIYAIKWTNKKGKSGFSVACDNEWVPNICEKPRIKCGECKNKSFKGINAQTIFDHLLGNAIIGVYPLLSDNTCHFLAVDFDKQGWQASVKAMALACKALEIPFAIEISQSGNGGHLWIFFSSPVTAKNARILGFRLLDKAMELQPSISFDSYDRLFPNQDVMPAGGFGNLIALPLQKEARKLGFSQFVNSELEPIPDQWQFLKSIKLLSSNQLESVLKKLNAFDINENFDMEEILPWVRPKVAQSDKIENLPKSVVITLANHLYFDLQALPGELAARLKRVASFSNPVFFKQQALRFSTNGIPRFISCARIENGPNNTIWLSLPRGCLDEVLTIFTQYGIDTSFADERNNGTKLLTVKFLGKLKKEQLMSVKIMCQRETGILHAPTAFGKTVAAIGIITKRKTNTLVLTHSKQLLEQWQERLKSFLEGVNIGVVGGGKKKPSGEIDVATYQSFINKKENTIDPLIREYGQVIIDECHHISAAGFEMVLNEVTAKYVLGLTATPTRQDGLQKIMFMLAGPIRHKVKTSSDVNYVQNVNVINLLDIPPDPLISVEERPHISDVYRWLAVNETRNRKLINDIKGAVINKDYPLVLTERREHARVLYEMLIKEEIDVVLLYGSMKAKELNSAKEKLQGAQVIVATGKYIGEGFDLPKLNVLFLAMPIAWKGTLAQYAGRIHREYDGKHEVTIFDYVDTKLPMLARMFKKREKGYLAMGYKLRLNGK